MIYDHINNVYLYKGLSPALDVGLEYISQVMNTAANGVSFLEHGVKVIVNEYVTKQRSENGYEAHRKYIDIQFPVKGEESVKVCPIKQLEPTTEYNEENDYILFADHAGTAFTIGEGFFLILFPDDGHMPQLCAGEPKIIKKITLKVPLK